MPNNKQVEFKVSTQAKYNSSTKDSGTFYLVKNTSDNTKARLYLGDILLVEFFDEENTSDTIVKRTSVGDIKITKGIESPDYEMKYDNEAKAVKFIFK